MVPVLDGTRAEYQQYVLSKSQLRKIEKQAEEDSKPAEGTSVQGETDAATPEAPTE